MKKNIKVVVRKPKLSTTIPDKVGPTKLPRKFDDAHIPEENTIAKQNYLFMEWSNGFYQLMFIFYMQSLTQCIVSENTNNKLT